MTTLIVFLTRFSILWGQKLGWCHPILNINVLPACCRCSIKFVVVKWVDPISKAHLMQHSRQHLLTNSTWHRSWNSFISRQLVTPSGSTPKTHGSEPSLHPHLSSWCSVCAWGQPANKLASPFPNLWLHMPFALPPHSPSHRGDTRELSPLRTAPLLDHNLNLASLWVCWLYLQCHPSIISTTYFITSLQFPGCWPLWLNTVCESPPGFISFVQLCPYMNPSVITPSSPSFPVLSSPLLNKSPAPSSSPMGTKPPQWGPSPHLNTPW